MEIRLRGTYFCVTGNFKGTNQDNLLKQIRAGGGKTHKKLSLETQVLICGEGYTPAKQTAIERGIPVLDGDALKRLLEGDVVIIETAEEKTPTQGLEDLLSTARASLSNSDHAAAWTSLVALLDNCISNEVSTLVDYLQGHIQRWTAEEQRLCKAPLHWLTAMSKEQDFAGYQLIRSLDFNDIDFNGTQLSKCLKRKDLTQVQSLNLAVAKKASATAFKVLLANPAFESVKHLGLGFFDEKILATLETENTTGSLTQLEALTIYPNEYWRIPQELYTTLGRLPIMQGLHTVIIGCRNSIGSSSREPIDNLCSELPALRRIELERYREEWADSYVPNPELRAKCVLTGPPL